MSVGSYWGAIPPNTELDLSHHEPEDYEPSDDWTIVSYQAPGQTVEKFIRNGRGSFCIDASLLGSYGPEDGWGYSATDLPEAWSHRNALDVEVKPRGYKRRQITAKGYHDGEAPTAISWTAPGIWGAVEGWGPDAGEDQFRTIAQFWGCAEGADADLNLNSDEEREAHLKRADEDEALNEALKNVMIYLYFDVMQIVNVKQGVGFDFEQGSGKMNGLGMDGDGPLDRDENGGLILQDAYGQDARLLPDWAYDLDFKQGWWVSLDGSLINEEGKKLVGANEGGSYILEG